MINLSTFTVDQGDGAKLTVTIEPVLIDLPGGEHFTGVYRLTETDRAGQELGEIAFHWDDSGQWEFIGEHFNPAEQEQIVEFIREREPLDSFTFTENSGGIEHHYRVTDNEGHFGIEKDGKVIAVIEHNEEWEQIDGEPLEAEVLNNITSRIEQHNR
ncbi:hypothetical protein SAMN05192574_105256 [Mucilaginibacter gossypiicola]|uniref:Uncharacterized protein n=1 Tax=Mucilaginibacter gossypiicola TaxID=551995 RepID=A0A1H8LUK2_9SPHI|nr:hypothetical protein [Mucilaginibacter gossypiicola]SEO08787.1 hypothetical protein SAMN05192574_105256 [Mucilaginibacter gossypiicola]